MDMAGWDIYDGHGRLGHLRWTWQVGTFTMDMAGWDIYDGHGRLGHLRWTWQVGAFTMDMVRLKDLPSHVLGYLVH